MHKAILFVLIFVCCGAVSPAAETTERDYRLDNEFFRRGLIDRGLDDWLAMYDKQHPPAGDLDLLAQQIGQAWLNYRRETDAAKRASALDVLLKLELDRVDSYPEHPLSAIWRVRYAGDMLNEQLAPQTYVHLIGFDLPQNRRGPFQTNLQEVETQLDKARKSLETSLAGFDRLDNVKLARMNQQGLPELYRSALMQADYLRAWCWYHRARLLDPGSPEQVKILYQLAALLEKLSPGNSDSAAGSTRLLSAGVARLLGKFPQARSVLKQAAKTLPASFLVYADIEQAVVALAENQGDEALKAVKSARQRPLGSSDGPRRDLLDAQFALLEGQARMKLLPVSERSDAARRNEIWRNLTAILIAKPQLRAFVFPRLLEISESCPQDALADVELFAHAERSSHQKKIPLAQTQLQDLLARKDAPAELRITAAAFLAGTYEQQGRFADALNALQTSAGASKGSQAAEIAAESARMAWLAYRAASNAKSRSVFIDTATRLLTQYPQHESADQFKLLMAEDFSQAGEFNQAYQWVQQIPPGSKLFLQAKAAKVLALSRQYDREVKSVPGYSTKPGSVAQRLADQIDTACKELLVIASATQPQPDKVETWTLKDEQVQLIAGAILASANVLADPELGRAKSADQLFAQYRPVLAKYEKTSKSAVATRILTLTQTATPAGLLEAITLARQLLDSGELPVSQTLSAVVQVLEAVHRSALSKQGDPTAKGDDVAEAGANLARLAENKLKSVPSVPSLLVIRLHALHAIMAVDAGRYSQAADILRQNPPKESFLDLDLARARLALAEKKLPDAVSLSASALQSVSPSDVRYWHALIINLHAHLALGSDPAQIAAAVIARQQEFPDLGNSATRRELLRILKIAQGTKS